MKSNIGVLMLFFSFTFAVSQAEAQNSDWLQKMEKKELFYNELHDDSFDHISDFSALSDDPLNQNYSTKFGVPGLDSYARAIVEFEGTICIGGRFTWFDGEIRLNHAACWDDAEDSWMQMGEGFNNTVHTLAVFEGDLYAGGAFTMSGEKNISRVAKWNNSEWQQVGGGLNGTVNSLSVYNGELIAGGSFNASETSLEEDLFLGTYTVTQEEPSSGPVGEFSNGWLLEGQQEFEIELNSVIEGRSFMAKPYAQFDGTAREFVLGFIEGNEENIVTLSDEINVNLTCDGTDIILGPALTIMGSFNHEDDSEFTFGIRDNTQEACVPYDDVLFTATKNSSSKQFASSFFRLNNIARFDGSYWKSMENGFNDSVWIVEIFDGILYAGGDFTESSGDVYNRVAMWNGNSWEAMGTGFNNRVLSFARYEGSVIAGGTFTHSGSESVLRIAEWDEGTETWNQVGDGFNSPFNSAVQDLMVFDSELYATGLFAGSGDEEISAIAKWNGSGNVWEAVITEELDQLSTIVSLHPMDDKFAASGSIIDRNSGINNFAFIENGLPAPETQLNFGLKGLHGIGLQTFLYNDEIIVGGGFNFVGDVEAANIAIWDGNSWSPMGDGLPGQVRAFTEYNNQLVAGVSSLNGSVYSWDESASEWNQIGGNTGLSVIWRMIVHNDSLYVAGDLSQNHINPLIRWNPGSEEWEKVGDGLDGSRARGVAVYNGELYAGGTFIRSGGDKVLNGIARWDEATYSWQPVGEGFSGSVNSLKVYENELYAAVSIFATDDEDINSVARWDNDSETWVNAGNEHLAGAFLTELSVYDGTLYVSGSDNNYGLLQKFDLETGDWSPLGSSPNNFVYNLVGQNGILHIAGFFTEIGGTPASGFVTYDTVMGVFAEKPATGNPGRFNLSQNYPNPFNPTTTIQFELPVNSEVKLEIFNLLGQRVATLVNDHVIAGAHEVIFDGSNLASGVYIYRITADDFMKTQKLTLIK